MLKQQLIIERNLSGCSTQTALAQRSAAVECLSPKKILNKRVLNRRLSTGLNTGLNTGLSTGLQWLQLLFPGNRSITGV
jgi:hypothetical protein